MKEFNALQIAGLICTGPWIISMIPDSVHIAATWACWIVYLILFCFSVVLIRLGMDQA